MRKVIVPAELDHDYFVYYYQYIDNIDLISDAHGNPYPYAEVEGADCRFEGKVLVSNSLKSLYPCVPFQTVTRCANACEYEKRETTAAIDASKHVFGIEPNIKIAATCAAEGHNLYNCLICEKTKDVVVDKLNHTWKVTKNEAATCDKAGIIEKTCTKCPAVETQTIAATGHNLVVETKDATCESAGYKKTTCTNKNCTYEKIDVINITHKAPAVDWDAIKNQNTILPTGYTRFEAPTCTTAGVRSYTCTLCGAAVKNETIPALNHVDPETGKSTLSAKPVTTVPATCEVGAYDVYKCSQKDCAAPYVQKFDLSKPATGHVPFAKLVPGSYKVKTPATCTEEGEAVYNCPGAVYTFSAKTGAAPKNTSCGKQLTGTIAKLGHIYESEWNPDTNKWELICIRCTGKDDIETKDATYTAAINGKKLTVKVVDKNSNTYDTLYARVSVGKQIGDVNYAVVYVVEIEWNFDAHGEEGTAILANIQGAGETTGISVVLTTDVNADEKTFAQALNGNVGTLIP